jgi:rod shape-determining protein MreD
VSAPAQGRTVIFLTLVAALLLSIMPMPLWTQWARPEWVAMVLIYWVMALPERVGIGIAGLTGLALDIVEGAPLGQNMFALGVLTYLVLILYQRLRMYNALQQSAVIFVLLGLNQLLCHWVQTMVGTPSPNLLFILPALVSAMIWPWLLIFLRFLRRHYYVS